MKFFLIILLAFELSFTARTMEEEQERLPCSDVLILLESYSSLCAISKFLAVSTSFYQLWENSNFWDTIFRRDFPYVSILDSMTKRQAYQLWCRSIVGINQKPTDGCFNNFMKKKIGKSLYLCHSKSESEHRFHCNEISSRLHNESFEKIFKKNVSIFFDTEDALFAVVDKIIVPSKGVDKVLAISNANDTIVVSALRNPSESIVDAEELSDDLARAYPNLLLVAARSIGRCRCCIKAETLAHIAVDCIVKDKFVRNHGVLLVVRAAAIIRSLRPYMSAAEVCSWLRKKDFPLDPEKISDALTSHELSGPFGQ